MIKAICPVMIRLLLLTLMVRSHVYQNANVWYLLIYSLLHSTEQNYDNSHSQKQDYSPHDVPDDHEIMMPPSDQNADPQHYQNHVLSGIGTSTQCRLCDICIDLSNGFNNNFTLQLFYISGDAPARKHNNAMTCFNSILLH